MVMTSVVMPSTVPSVVSADRTGRASTPARASVHRSRGSSQGRVDPCAGPVDRLRPCPCACHPVSSARRPSVIRTRRPARRLTASSWVITTRVTPWAHSSSKRSSTETVFSLSRLPVGSSQSSSAGSTDQRPCDGDPLALAAGQPVGPETRPVTQPHPLQRLTGAGEPAAAPATGARPAVRLRQHHVLVHASGTAADGRTGTRTRSGCRAARCVRGRRARWSPPRPAGTSPAVGRSSRPSVLSSVDLPEPEAPTMARCSPAPHGQVHPAQRVHGRLGVEGPPHIGEFDDARPASDASAASAESGGSRSGAGGGRPWRGWAVTCPPPPCRPASVCRRPASPRRARPRRARR